MDDSGFVWAGAAGVRAHLLFSATVLRRQYLEAPPARSADQRSEVTAGKNTPHREGRNASAKQEGRVSNSHATPVVYGRSRLRDVLANRAAPLSEANVVRHLKRVRARSWQQSRHASSARDAEPAGTKR